jgi:hypothetical protein
MNIHGIIDQFVACIDPSASIFHRLESAPWVEVLETRLPKRFPTSFQALLTRYAFQTFDADGISFFANTGGDSNEELSVAIFNDRIIADTTMKAGYIQFARPEGGSYDPICFDARLAVNNREFPIVRLCHEEILCRDRILVSETIADSFYRFVAARISSAKQALAADTQWHA